MCAFAHRSGVYHTAPDGKNGAFALFLRLRALGLLKSHMRRSLIGVIVPRICRKKIRHEAVRAPNSSTPTAVRSPAFSGWGPPANPHRPPAPITHSTLP